AAETAGLDTGVSHARDRDVRPAGASHQARLRLPDPRPTVQAPARRSRKGAVMLAGVGVTIAAVVAVIVAATATSNGHGSGPQQVRHYGLLRKLAPPSAGAIIEAVAFSPAGGATAAVADNKGGVYLWNAAGGNSPRTIASLAAHGSGALDVAFSPDGSELAAAFKNGDIVLW